VGFVVRFDAVADASELELLVTGFDVRGDALAAQ